PVIDDQPGLLLLNGFSRVERERRRHYLPWILQKLFTRQAEWILRQRLVAQIEYAGHRGGTGKLPLELAVELRTPCGTVIAVAVGFIMKQVQQSAYLLAGDAQRRSRLLLAVA